MFTANDRAFVQDATAELKLLEAMRKGAKLAITATTGTGKQVTDSYSLSGLGQAMGELQSTCF
jgi:invasion protein IalB